MPDPTFSDTDIIWKRVGLEELREKLEKVKLLSEHFEQALRNLPSCDECARAVLFEQIKKTGNDLSGEVLSLTVLSETLRSVVAAVEKSREKLTASPAPACRCSGNPCACHHDSQKK